MKEIKIDGITYIPKQETLTDYIIIRTYSAGVFAGELEKEEGDTVILKNARRLWRWAGAASLSQLAMDGVSSPDECKFPCEVVEIKLFNVIEKINCTAKAKKSIAEVPVWKE
jgi:hypothetical protein